MAHFRAPVLSLESSVKMDGFEFSGTLAVPTHTVWAKRANMIWNLQRLHLTLTQKTKKKTPTNLQACSVVLNVCGGSLCLYLPRNGVCSTRLFNGWCYMSIIWSFFNWTELSWSLARRQQTSAKAACNTLRIVVIIRGIGMQNSYSCPFPVIVKIPLKIYRCRSWYESAPKSNVFICQWDIPLSKTFHNNFLSY